MPQLQYSDTDLIYDETALLFQLSLELSRRRLELENRCKGEHVIMGDHRGVLSSITQHGIILTGNDGTQKIFPVTRARVRQLLAAQTMRK